MDEIGAKTTTTNRNYHNWLAGLVATFALLMAAVILFNIMDKPSIISGVVHFNRQLRGHDNSIVYPTSDLPPPGGVHHNQFQNCGIYSSSVETGKVVHAMEHGAVWVSYEPGLAADEIAFLQEKVRGEEYLLLSPYPGQKSPVVVTAWGVQLELRSAFDERLDEFIARYRLGPTTPERGATCTGGFGDPSPVD